MKNFRKFISNWFVYLFAILFMGGPFALFFIPKAIEANCIEGWIAVMITVLPTSAMGLAFAHMTVRGDSNSESMCL